MPLTFKLVGNNGNHDTIKINFEGNLNIASIHNDFKNCGLSQDELNNIKFITDSDTIKDDKSYTITKDEDRLVYVFSANHEVRMKLSIIFQKLMEQKNSESVEMDTGIIQPIVENPVVMPTEEDIATINKQTVKLMEDPDFTNLLDIYMRRPELFNTLSKFIQHGTIVKEFINVKQYCDLSEEEITHYKTLAAEMKINISEEIKIKQLIKYNGHTKLALRSILSEGLYKQ
jgi:hypothetical protein